jgi:hypothetical protein
VDPFAVIMLGGVAILLLFVMALGRFNKSSVAEILDWRTPETIYETQAALEAEDVSQMIASQNARRRARGKPELSEEQIELRVAEDLRAAQAQREAYLADLDVAEMLEHHNARRRSRGRRELSLEELQARLARERGGS